MIAFTAWVEGPTELTDVEAQRLLSMMTFGDSEGIEGYRRLLSESGCDVKAAEDTGRFTKYMDLFLNMIEMQLNYDFLATLAFRKGSVGSTHGHMPLPS